MTKDEIINLLDDLNRTRAVATMNRSDIPPNARSSWEINIRQAQDSLLQLEADYVAALQDDSVVVALVGEGKDAWEFARIAKEEGVPLVVDIGDFYWAIAQRVEQTLSKDRTWGVSQHALTIELALNNAVDLGMKNTVHDTMQSFSSSCVPAQVDTMNMVRSTIRSRLGDDIQAMYVRKVFRESALNQQLVTEKLIGVLIVGSRDAAEATELKKAWPTALSSVVPTPSNPTTEQVVKVFQKAKKSSQKKQQTETQQKE